MAVERFAWGEFERLDTLPQAWIARDILAGRTYPYLPFVSNVRTIVDIGANVGAAAVWFARCYPDAAVYALEPSRDPFSVLARNSERWPTVQPFRLGLSSRNEQVALYTDGDSVLGSVKGPTGTAEPVTLCRADQWFDEHVSSTDVLKVDTEGCEIEILECLGDRVDDIKVIYIEAHSDADRRAIDRILADRHRQVFGRLMDATGEYVYVLQSIIAGDPDGYREWVVETERARLSNSS